MKKALIGFLGLVCLVFLMGCPNGFFTVAAPTISPPDGSDLSSGSAQVSISSTTSHATIYYTRDGSIPDSSSTLYTGPFTVIADHAPPEVIKAVAIKAWLRDSPVTTVTYNWGW